jgi:hypothetical protein
MMSVMTAKWVGDALNKHGIYAAWIAMRGYPWLPPVDYTDRGKTGAHVMKRVERLVVIEDGECTVRELGVSSLVVDGVLIYFVCVASRDFEGTSVPRLSSSVSGPPLGLSGPGKNWKHSW